MSIENSLANVHNKEILQSLIERKAQYFLNEIDNIAAQLFVDNPAINRIAMTFINIKKREYIPTIQHYCDLLVETSFIDPNISLEEGIENAEKTLNDLLSQFISKKLDLSYGTVNISLKALFGDSIIKL